MGKTDGLQGRLSRGFGYEGFYHIVNQNIPHPPPPYNVVRYSMKFYFPSNYHLRCWIRGADKNGRNRYHKTWLCHCNRCLPLMSAAMWKHKFEISGKYLSQIVQSKGDIFVSLTAARLFRLLDLFGEGRKHMGGLM